MERSIYYDITYAYNMSNYRVWDTILRPAHIEKIVPDAGAE